MNNLTFREMREAGSDCPECGCCGSADIEEPNHLFPECIALADCPCHYETCDHPDSLIEPPDTEHDGTTAWCARCEQRVIPAFSEDGFEGYEVL